ncbi:Phage integrase family protein OS=Bosea thiooxidans OX=53254 GN=SAMN05660750_04310 PE=4 SV=1 [Bosea thiooxidans]|uniref:Phage integrase family protein n=1 Tax=Bosea thiooxidans TaxID=53254 RepID=A0A1T5GQP1_9HYPH|nr:hypothetical protein [Bosea thiooxidans]SKC10733.1 hypothetical protein SAMN05660750_04310 [Bosea thiooxidans]
MPTDANSRLLVTKISEFCRKRLTPSLHADTERLQTYLVDLISRREYPPTRGRGIDWRLIAYDCGIDHLRLAAIKEEVRPALDAIVRAFDAAAAREARPRFALQGGVAVGEANPPKPRTSAIRRARLQPDLFAANDPGKAVNTLRPSQKRGVKPKIVVDFPQALDDRWEDPGTFREALMLHMQRHGETYWHLHRAIVDAGESFDIKTIRSWVQGTRSPASTDSLAILQRIERRYRLPDGYFRAKLPHQGRAARGHELEDISPSERRRLAWHLPDNFNSLPHAEREKIVEWVRRVIISGATDYRRFQAAAAKQRYAIRFPGVAYGRPEPIHDPGHGTRPDEELPLTDPDLLSGVVDAPPELTMEMAGLVRFKTSTLTALGLQRNGVWGEETTSQKIEHLGLMLGALAASPKGVVRGYGVPLEHLTLGLLVFPGIWDWYVQWRERRRGFYTAWEVDMLRIALAMTRQETGWLRQHRHLVQRVRPIPGLVSTDEIERARADWDGACDAFYKHATGRAKEIQRVARVHRDPFEPIMPVLEAPSPVGEYRKITEEILKRTPDPSRYPRGAAEAVRAFLLLRLGLHLGLRQKNLRQLMVCPRGHFPRSERQLEDTKRGELRWSDRDGGWEVLIPAVAFKNATSSYFGSKPFRLVLPDLGGLNEHIETYITRHRKVLLSGADDPGTFFVKTVKQTSTDPAYDQTTFYEAWRLTIQRYGIFNPFTGRGAIRGLLPHGPHNVRDVLATHILKQTGSYEQASYAIQDTPEMVQNHYGRFLPQDKAALAAKILNQVWEAA